MYYLQTSGNVVAKVRNANLAWYTVPASTQGSMLLYREDQIIHETVTACL